MSVFRIKGKYRTKNKMTQFTMEISALKEAHAIEKSLSLIGSKHRVPRKFIKITEIKQIRAEEVTDPIVKSVTSELSQI